MATISFANPKGGSGKTTLAAVLAQELAHRGARVAVIDADPNAIIAAWATRREGEGLAVPFTVVSSPSEAEMVKTIASLSSSHDFVFIDLEGTASRLMSRALARSHLVLIPFNPSPIDAKLAASAVGVVVEESEALEREIPYRLICSRSNAAIQTKSARRIFAAIDAAELPVLEPGLVERAAYRDIFDFGRTLYELEEGTTSGLPKARQNAAQVADSVISVLNEIAERKAA